MDRVLLTVALTLANIAATSDVGLGSDSRSGITVRDAAGACVGSVLAASGDVAVVARTIDSRATTFLVTSSGFVETSLVYEDRRCGSQPLIEQSGDLVPKDAVVGGQVSYPVGSASIHLVRARAAAVRESACRGTRLGSAASGIVICCVKEHPHRTTAASAVPVNDTTPGSTSGLAPPFHLDAP